MKDQTLHDIFVTALEGGIGYWCGCLKYHWNAGNAPDLVNFYAIVKDDESKELPNEWRIDRDTIIRGIESIAYGEVKIRPNIRSICIGLTADDPMESDAMNHVDAEIADCIVQAGLFKEIVYG